MEVKGFRLKQGCSDDEEAADPFPCVSANNGHAGDVLVPFLEEADFLPAGGKVDAFHVGKLGEDSDRAVFAGLDQELNLLFHRFFVLDGHAAKHFEADDTAGTFF